MTPCTTSSRLYTLESDLYKYQRALAKGAMRQMAKLEYDCLILQLTSYSMQLNDISMSRTINIGLVSSLVHCQPE